MENNTEIYSLFPTPLLVSSFPPSFSRIIPWLDSQPMEPLELLQENQHGTTSENTYILNDNKCVEIKDFLLEKSIILGKSLGYKCDHYKLTQSWITHKIPNQSHLPHNHTNSFFSGVFFYGNQINSTLSASISFHKPPNNQLLSIPQDINLPPTPYSINNHTFTPSPGDFLIFPSSLIHSVLENNTNEIRKSLAFNIVPVDGFGNEGNLNRLKFN